MNRLVQVGITTWVDPEAIQAIEWGPYSDCPVVWMGSVRVSAKKFKRGQGQETAEECTNNLLALISKAMRKPTPPKFQGRTL